MRGIMGIKEKMQQFYAEKTLWVDKVFQFILAFVTFYLINKNMGFFTSVTSPVITLGLSVICTFLSPIVTVLAAALLVVLHLFKVSLGVAAAAALVFIMMYIFYCRFTPKKAVVLLLTPLAFWLNIPYALPIVCGLASTPISVVPVAFGTIVHFMLSYVTTAAEEIAATEGVSAQVVLFMKSVFQNQEMWVAVLTFTIGILTVYFMRRRSINHAWTIAIAAGVIVNVVVGIMGATAFDIELSYSNLIVGNVLAVVMGAILELFLFSVDYAKAEHLQYEDDEYYYYVKAVPKITTYEQKKNTEKTETCMMDEEDDESEVIRRKVPRKSELRKAKNSYRW